MDRIPRMLMPTSGKSGFSISPPPAPQVQHQGVKCDGCGMIPIRGARFKCGNCADYDLCEACNKDSASKHDSTHVFIKMKRTLPQGQSFSSPLLPKNLYADQPAPPTSKPIFFDWRMNVVVLCNLKQLLNSDLHQLIFYYFSSFSPLLVLFVVADVNGFTISRCLLPL